MKVIPPVIFFDASGTLFDVRGSVGEIYQRLAARHGLLADAAELQNEFKRAFGLQPPLAFPVGLAPAELDRCERAWWRALVADVFGVSSKLPAFDDFFHEVYAAFTHAEAWQVFPDVAPALQALRSRGIRLAVLSNFDSRLDVILAATGLAQYFDAVYVSTRCGAAKPDGRFFQFALQAQGVRAAEVWHVGDALREDIEGANAAGVRAFWIQRHAAHADVSLPHTPINSLLSLLEF
jgi:putative hydrolase of the HAD superfamily